MMSAPITSPIALELLRSQLQSITDNAVETVIRTAISPIVNEAKDCGAVIFDHTGRLVTGGGMGTIHWLGCARAIRATMERYGDDVGEGDVFLANDPYNGGGMHPADVVIQRPIFLQGQCIGWTAFSAHMMDMGGMSIGSWAPTATECYQEALRIPPVRLIKSGKDVREVWDILRTNIRFFALVEMDMRCLIAGCHVADTRLRGLVSETGMASYQLGVDRLVELSERELKKILTALVPGEYSSVGWAEWGERFVRVPCQLRVIDGRLSFDFDGADPQVPFFINTQPYIIKTYFMPQLVATLAPDLPFNEGVLRLVDVRCPEGSVVHAVPPVPMNSGHIHLAGAASETMYRCLRLAIWASPGLCDTAPAMGAEGYSALATNSWYGVGDGGVGESWMITDGIMTGGCASRGADGTDFTMKSLDLPARDLSQPGTFDVETYEAWFPMMMRERRLSPGSYGAGRWRAGAALSHSFEPYGTQQLIGQMIGTRGRLPLNGEAGGRPGAVTRFRIRGRDGSYRSVPMAGADVVVATGERFEVSSASSGGWGDPLQRPPEEVGTDVLRHRLSAQDATSIYGVVFRGEEIDVAGTDGCRASMRAQRLKRAMPPRARSSEVHPSGTRLPLYPGVVQVGRCAVAIASGAVLTEAPNHWTEGCAVMEEESDGVLIRSYLDPVSGDALLVEAVPAGSPRSFASLPDHWTDAA
jgi:N-methylhydantoinase B